MTRFLGKLLLLLSIVSWTTIAWIIVKGVTGWSGPEWFSHWLFPILVSAAVGYLTNYIAIEMLFKPYDRTGFHWLRIASLGVWQQGMVPANKAKIGRVLSEEIPERLLNPEAITQELYRKIAELTTNPELLGQIRVAVQHLLRKHEEAVIGFLVPRIEQSIKQALDENLTPEALRKFWDSVLSEWLSGESNRRMLAAGIVSGLREKTPEFRELLREMLRDGIRRYINDRLPFIPRAGEFVSGMINYLDWDDIERQIAVKLEDERTRELIVSELARQSVRLRDWLYSEDAAPKLDEFLSGAKGRLEQFLHAYLMENVPQMTSQILSSDALWEWIRQELLPTLQRYLDFWMAREGRRLILEMLDLNNRIEQSIANQDVREFHGMINRIAAEHLGAIQLLGYLLGAIVGALQQLAG